MMQYKIRSINSFSKELIATTYKEMTPSRKSRCDRYRFEADKMRMLCAEALLKELVFEITGANSADTVIENKENGAPFAVAGGKEFFASISHSKDFVAVALSSAPVGIDIEANGRASKKLVDRVATDEEKAYIYVKSEGENLTAEEQKRFLQIWTAKEAYVKLKEEGIKAGLKNINTIPFFLGKGKYKYIGESKEEYTLSLLFCEE